MINTLYTDVQQNIHILTFFKPCFLTLIRDIIRRIKSK